MQANKVNRQENRYSDVYLEPEYDQIATINVLPLPAPATKAIKIAKNNDLTATDKKAFATIRQSVKLEKDVFWVVYVSDLYPISFYHVGNLSIDGMTSLNYQISLVFTSTITLKYPAGQVADGMNKTAVHEVGHQILHSMNHFGNGKNIEKYADPATDKTLAGWKEVLNVMNEAAIQVPMNNPLSGPTDWFYFRTQEIAKMRLKHKSP